MSTNKRLTRDEILLIPDFIEEGLTYQQIGEKLGVTKLTIARWIPKLRQYGYFVPEIKRGRPRVIKKHD